MLQWKGKGKEKATEIVEDSSDSASTSDVDSDTSSSCSSDSEPVTQEYLDSLLEKARKNALSLSREPTNSVDILQGDVVELDDEPGNQILPLLDPGNIPKPYFEFDESRHNRPTAIRDPDIELAEKSSSVPAPPIPPPELTKGGKVLTKKQRKALKQRTAGPGWFDMPAPAEADLPRLYREVEAMRLRNYMDPKRFYRKDEGEGKGIKGLPKHFAIGTIVTANTPFGGGSSDNLTRANRKRTLVDELVDDAEAKRYAKKKFEDLQSVRGARGKNTLQAKKRQKW
ncbi:Fcf2-domain-containing protein [Guyanagaster necrorhizus]|uniref:Fcf2-domain-containing protein n=1 Tax=Guyanagaster necrorhizus TaxID=856835 RepID=A0A9P7VL38_9AGAR|nr:Fcf2-domain-containing protein [Guyanagaster necrorhizus MCA 3950]KAG7443113.1 Fcf2-domain-containing protein [Guyanagaster necrorhizus MCA 3950]